jgi:hypothetical protein
MLLKKYLEYMKKKNNMKDMPNYYSSTITQKDVVDAIKEMKDDSIPEGIDKNYPMARCGPYIIYTYNNHYDMSNKKWGYFENKKWIWK